ncbi:MAG: hypothetical protein ACTHKM_03475 [Tsuneonella sp.]
MITADAHPPAASFAARLAAKAAKLAAARAEERRLAGAADPRRWRSARLLWPLLGDR